MPEYNPNYNYISAHLSWVYKRKTFVPKIPMANHVCGVDMTNVTYYDLLREWYDYSRFGTYESKNRQAYMNYNDDKKWLQEQCDIEASLMGAKPSENALFVTLGFDHGLFTVSKALAFVRRILSKSCVLDGFAVLEYHRQDGEHPHVHMKLVVDKKKTSPKQLRRQIWETRDRAQLISSQNFIDTKPYNHDNYMDGVKAPEKMPYVELDKVWREKNNIPEKIYKE